MAHNQQQPKQSQPDMFGLVYGLLNGHATSLAVFLRTGFGVEALGWSGILALVMILVVAANAAPNDHGMLVFLLLWFIAQCRQRYMTMQLVRKGVILHSYYPGYPWIAMKMPFVRNVQSAISQTEPVLCLVIGLLMLPVSLSIGMFIGFGFFSFAFRDVLERQVRRKRLQGMHDAEIEQRYYADAYRRGDRD